MAMTKAPRARRGRRALLATVDYTLAKRALLGAVRAGLTSWTDVCDAHPELMRAAKHVGETSRRDCPFCGKAKLKLVTYVYGDGLREPAAGSGRSTWAVDSDRSPRVRCYVVEVCTCAREPLSEASWRGLTPSRPRNPRFAAVPEKHCRLIPSTTWRSRRLPAGPRRAASTLPQEPEAPARDQGFFRKWWWAFVAVPRRRPGALAALHLYTHLELPRRRRRCRPPTSTIVTASC
jgi:hypothetical protein